MMRTRPFSPNHAIAIALIAPLVLSGGRLPAARADQEATGATRPQPQPVKEGIKGPFDSIKLGRYNGWTFPEGGEKTWGTAPVSAAKLRTFSQGEIGGAFLLLSTSSLNDKDTGKAVWQGLATDAFLNVTIAGGADKNTRLQVKGPDGKVIGRLSGDGTLNFKWKCIALGEDLIGKPVTLEALDSSETSSIAISNISFGDRPETLEQEQLEEIIATCRRSLRSPGQWVALAVDGEIVACEAYGFRKRSDGTPAMLSDVVRIASISKPVSGTVIGLLVDKGIISYSTKIKDVFPELIGKCNPICLDATLGQLTTHTSGITYSASLRAGESSRSDRYRYMVDALNNPTNIPPGTKDLYAGGLMIGCAMIDKLTGKSFDDYVREYMIQKLGIRSLNWSDDSDSSVWGHNERGKESTLGNTPGYPIGGYKMTITDLAKFGSIHSEGSRSGYEEFSADAF